jgi:hypothetical protein
MQADLDKITACCNKWQMYLNSSKCKIMHIGKKNPQLTYTIANPNGSISMLESTTCEKDLGITITSNLKWSNHVYSVASKANQAMGMLRLKVLNLQTLEQRSYFFENMDGTHSFLQLLIVFLYFIYAKLSRNVAMGNNTSHTFAIDGGTMFSP